MYQDLDKECDTQKRYNEMIRDVMNINKELNDQFKNIKISNSNLKELINNETEASSSLRDEYQTISDNTERYKKLIIDKKKGLSFSTR